MKFLSNVLIVFFYISIFFFSADRINLAKGIDIGGWWWILFWFGIIVAILFTIRKQKSVLLHSALGSFIYLPLRMANIPTGIAYEPMNINREKFILPQIPLILGFVLLALYFYKKFKDKKTQSTITASKAD